MPTVIVAPVLRTEARVPYSRTSVRLTFREEILFASVAELIAIERGTMTHALGNLLEFEDDLRRALDLVFTGF